MTNVEIFGRFENEDLAHQYEKRAMKGNEVMQARLNQELNK